MHLPNQLHSLLDKLILLPKLLHSLILILLICWDIISSLEGLDLISKSISTFSQDIGILLVINRILLFYNSLVLKFGSKDVNYNSIDVSWFKELIELSLSANNDDNFAFISFLYLFTIFLHFINYIYLKLFIFYLNKYLSI